MEKNEIATLPNLISFIRLILIPVFCIYLIEGNKEILIILFLIIFVGDALDGFIARKLKQETVFGKFFDAIVDTVFIFSSIIILYIIGQISLLYAILLLIPRAFTFLKGVYNYIKNKKIDYKTSIYRKIAGAILALLIFISILRENTDIEALVVIISNYLLLILELYFPRN